ncbi:MAG: class I SAM-dependent methyltransferase, partial [Actinomycetota bacterium]
MPPRHLESDRRALLRDARRNRRAWDSDSEEYQREHARQFRGEKAAAWGLWRIPEDELQVLGAVRGKRTLELGCGAARWSHALRDRGALPVALDNSFNQLQSARGAGGRVALVQADGELLPFGDESFDVVFSDYGVMSFADPLVT